MFACAGGEPARSPLAQLPLAQLPLPSSGSDNSTSKAGVWSSKRPTVRTHVPASVATTRFLPSLRKAAVGRTSTTRWGIAQRFHQGTCQLGSEQNSRAQARPCAPSVHVFRNGLSTAPDRHTHPTQRSRPPLAPIRGSSQAGRARALAQIMNRSTDERRRRSAMCTRPVGATDPNHAL